MSGEELPLRAAQCRADDGDGGFAPSRGAVPSRDHDDRVVAMLELEREARRRDRAGRPALAAAVGLRADQGHRLARSRPSRATSYTTLPERRDRMLFTFIDIALALCRPVGSRVGAGSGALRRRRSRSPTSRPSVFHEFVSLSIQHLVHEIGLADAGALPGADEVTLRGPEPDLGPVGRGSRVGRSASRCSPTRGPPYGRIGLTMRRE